MRKLLLSSLSLLAMAGSAVAADLPSTKAAPAYVPPPPVFSWTGFYIGVEGGGDFRQYRDYFGNYSLTKDAGLIGGLIGYNWATGGSFINGGVVLGLEGDAAAVLGGNRGYTYNGVAVYNNTYNSSYAAAIRGRVGLAYDRLLVYAAGGVAFGDARINYSTPLLASAAYTSSRTGWTVGGGVDYAFTPNWIGRIEYRYVDLGKGGYYNYGAFLNDGIRVTSNEVIAGLIYKFGAPIPAPVVAKY